MENQPAIISFLLPHDVQLVATDISFWDTIHKQGTEIDRLPGFGHDLAMALVDWLFAEFGISQLWASNVSLCPNTLMLGLFDRHELNVLRTRLAKRTIQDTTAIVEAYGLASIAPINKNDWMGFFMRQYKYVQSNGHRLVIVCVENRFH